MIIEYTTPVNVPPSCCPAAVEAHCGSSGRFQRRAGRLHHVLRAAEEDLLQHPDQTREISKKYELSKQNQEGYLRLREDYNNNKDILSLFVLTCYSFNHQIRFNNSHQFNTPFGRDRSSYNQNIEKNLIEFCTALREKDIRLISDDFSKVDLSSLGKYDIVYCDPPYLLSTATYNDGKRGFKDWGLNEENQLLNMLDKLNANQVKFAVSNVLFHKGNTNELLLQWAKNYNINYLNMDYSNCSYQFKEKGAKTVEVLITNY